MPNRQGDDAIEVIEVAYDGRITIKDQSVLQNLFDEANKKALSVNFPENSTIKVGEETFSKGNLTIDNDGIVKFEGLTNNTGGKVDELLNRGKLFGKFSKGEFLEIISKKQKLFGGNKIVLSKTKTTTITGGLSDVNVVARRGQSLQGVTKMGDNVGGINILRSPKWQEIITKHTDVNGIKDWNKISNEFWETVNKPWLDDAIARGDNFRFVSDPANDFVKYVNNESKFVLDTSGKKIKSIFWREFEYLKSKGYKLLSDGTLSK